MAQPAISTTPAPGAAEQVIFEGRQAALYSVGRWLVAILTVGIGALAYWLAAVGRRVRMTNQRLVLKTGLLTVNTEYVELYRVTDLRVEEPLLERMLGYGRLIVTSSDRSDPVMTLRGIKNPEELADRLRQSVELQKRARRVATISEA